MVAFLGSDSKKKWFLSIINFGLNGQTTNYLRLVDELKKRHSLEGSDKGPQSCGFLRWVKNLRKKAREGIWIQIHIPSAAWIPLFVPFFPGFRRVEFYLEGHLIEPDSVTWESIGKYPSFLLPRLILNRAFWVSLLVFAGFCPRVMVASLHQRKELITIGYPASLISRLPNCRPVGSAARAVSKVKPEPVILGYLGHGTPVKGLEVLFEALLNSKIRALPWNLRLAIGREGKERIKPLLENLKSALGDRVEIFDRVDSWSFLKSLDLLVLPYIVDFGTMVYPVTLVDAMHAGAIPIVSRFPSLTEPLGGMRERYFFMAGKANELGEALSHWILKDPTERQACSLVLQKKAQRRWGSAWDKRMERLFA